MWRWRTHSCVPRARSFERIGAAFIVCLAALSAQTTPDATSSEARALWERMLADQGGREQLAAVFSIEETERSIVPAFKPSQKDSPSTLVDVFVLPDRMWSWFDGGSSVFGLSLNVINIGQNLHYIAYPGEPCRVSQTMEPGARALWVAELVYLNDCVGLHPEPDHLGVMIPEKVTESAFSKHPDRNNEVKLHSFDWDYKVDLNVPFRDDVFTKPPDMAAGPYAWRPGNAP